MGCNKLILCIKELEIRIQQMNTVIKSLKKFAEKKDKRK